MFIRTFNRAVSDAVNKENNLYQSIIGKIIYTSVLPIVESSDVNCGALCNELEFCRLVSNYYVQSFDIDLAETENLEALITGFVDLPRRNIGESDITYRRRYKFSVVEYLNPRRTTKWAIIDAIRYFIPAAEDQVQVIELWDSYNLYFQVRIEGVVNYDDAIFINNTEQSYIDQDFIGGAGVGEVISYLGEMIDRIKAAGVDYDILFVAQDRDAKTIDCIIGSVQRYKTILARIRGHISTTKYIDAVIV